MEILSDRIGVLLKYGKMMGGLTKRYFFIDNKGTLFYTEKEAPILELLKFSSYDNDKFVAHVMPHSKLINLIDCSISGVKSFLENKFDLQGRSYFELFVKARDYRSILLFAWKEEYINSLHDYVASFRELNNEEVIFDEKEMTNFVTEGSKLNKEVTMSSNFMQMDSISHIEKSSGVNIFTNAKDKKTMAMESVLAKLGGRFVNQKDWEKDSIKIVNPTSDLVEYEETWVELENGSNYSGSVKNGMPHGFGKEYRPDGSLYTGYFNKGKWHGPGTLTNETLDSYQGEFIDGCICGI